MNFIYKENEILKWKDAYEIHKSAKKVAELFGVSSECVIRRLRMIGVETAGNRKFFCNDDFFSADTPESFYWAGFIAADGCVHKQKNSDYLIISLAVVDKEHLNKFSKAIKFTGNVKVRKHGGIGQDVCSINICSKKITADLIRFNVVPRKTKIYDFPEWIIDHKYVNHFMRGYFDGDGCILIGKTKSRNRLRLNMSIVGNHDFLQTYRNILIKYCNVSSGYFRVMKSIFELAYCGNINVVKIRSFLYSGANDDILLTRKHDKFFNDWIDNKPRSTRCKPIIATFDDKVVKYDAISDAAKDGYDRSCIYDSLKNKSKKYKGALWRYY